MQRKHFIRLSSASIASLAFKKINFLTAEVYQALRTPEEVWIQSEDQWISLKLAADQWTYKDVIVTAMHSADVLPVSIQSPTLSIQAVRVKWKYDAASKPLCLGDHWERTYGDVSWQPLSVSRKAPWYLIVNDAKGTSCFGVKTGCNSICYWQADEHSLQLTMDTRSGGNGVQLGSRKLHCADIISMQTVPGEKLFAAAQRFCRMMCEKPMLPTKPVYGINDWYFAYGNNSKDLILQHTSLMADLAQSTVNRPFSVIDAGWAEKSPLSPDDCCWGDDFAKPNSKFGDMSVVASEIKKLGMRPGLWVRPLCAHHYDSPTLLMPSIKGRNDPKMPVLDPTIPENLKRIYTTISGYKEWGYEMVKHDFTTFDIFGLWGFEMTDQLTAPGWHFDDVSKTNAEIILQLYKTIRAAAGDMYLIGCNTMSHLSAGIFELNRIGDDTSGNEWARTKKMGVNTMGFRVIQHKAFYAVDGDCVGITVKVPWEKNKQWMQLLAESSAPLFISGAPEAVGAEQKQFIKKSFDQAAADQPIAEPLDWLSNPFPSKWKLNGREVDFEW